MAAHRQRERGNGVQLHSAVAFDNSATPARFITVKPLAAAMGAEISGVDIRSIVERQAAEIRSALFRHKMIYFRNQRLSHAEHEAFSLHFGPFAEDAYTGGAPGHRNVHPLIKEADDKSEMVFGEGWHTDSPFLPRPPSITTLRSVEIPPYGGDTIWCNAALAYRALSETYRTMIDGLRVRFSIRDVLALAQRAAEDRDTPMGRLGATRNAPQLPEHLVRKISGNAHPLVRTHPETGERSLYVDETYSIAIEGMSDVEAAPILKFLREHIAQHAFTCRLRWEPDMLAVWDNRLCIHRAFNDYHGYRRELYRTTILGETPS
jgi:alpha-ketoglutarate-dependent taurine dioxygenase